MPRKVDDWIQGYMDYTENSEPPTTYKKWVAISLIASVLQRKCYLEWGPITFFPNMYIVLVGPSGRCRKGTAMGIGAKFLNDIGIKMAAEATTREALIKSLHETEDFQTDAGGNIDHHSSLTIFSPELTVFLGYNNLQLISDLTDWYDCRDQWEYRTKNSGTNTIKGVYVNLIGATTPDLIRSALPQDAVGGGLSSRMIFVSEYEKSKIVATPFLDEDDIKLYRNLKHDLEMIYTMRGGFKITDEFVAKWVDWYTNANKNPPFRDNPKFEGYINRRGNHVLKLCMILSASEGDDMVIRSSTLSRAVGILEEVEKKMPTVFYGHGTSDNADVTGRILQTIEAHGDKGISSTQLMRTYIGYVQDHEAMMKLLEKLTIANFIKWNKDTGMIYPDQIEQ